MANESDDTRSGIRTYLVTYPDGTSQLTIGLVFEGSELRAPGEWGARLRAMLQRIERDYPGLCGDDAGASDIEKVDVMKGKVDASKAYLN